MGQTVQIVYILKYLTHQLQARFQVNNTKKKLRSLQKMQFALRYFNVYESSCSNQIMENSSRVFNIFFFIIFFNEKVILNF